MGQSPNCYIELFSWGGGPKTPFPPCEIGLTTESSSVSYPASYNLFSNWRSTYSPSPLNTPASHTPFACSNACDSPQDSLHASVVELTAAVATLTANQKFLHSAFEAQQQQQQQPLHRGRSSQKCKNVESRQRRTVRCYNCNQMGHYAKACPSDASCSLCFGWGHSHDQCANNFVQQQPTDTATITHNKPTILDINC